MNLPISAIKNLELAGVEYQTCLIFDDNNEQVNPWPAAAQTCILVVLEDSIGKLQCALTRDHFIDLTMLCETLGRNLKGLSPSEILRNTHSLGLEVPSSLPGLTNYPCVISPEILASSALYFESGKTGVFVKLDQKNIQALFQNSEKLNFSRAIKKYTPPETSHINGDEALIQKAVENFTSLRIKQRLESTLEIPPMPDTSRKIVQLRVDPEAGVAELASVVETDPSLAAQVVSWAGSPYYAAPGRINSVHDAVIRVLGFDLVINLALGLSLGKGLEIPQDGSAGITPYWKQAVYCAASAELIARQIPKQYRPEPGLAYLSGLLHNFGYLVLGQVFPPHLALINRHAEANPHVPLNVLEFYLIGVTREQLAAWLFHSWNMPEEIVTAVRWQNSAHYSGPMHSYANVLFLANQVLHAHNVGAGPEETIPIDLLSNLSLSEVEVQQATRKIWNNMEHLDALARNFDRS